MKWVIIVFTLTWTGDKSHLTTETVWFDNRPECIIEHHRLNIQPIEKHKPVRWPASDCIGVKPDPNKILRGSLR